MWVHHTSLRLPGKPLQWPFSNGTVGVSPKNAGYVPTPKKIYPEYLKIEDFTILYLIFFSFWGMLQFQKLWLR